jgi:hypothetical protein
MAIYDVRLSDQAEDVETDPNSLDQVCLQSTVPHSMTSSRDFSHCFRSLPHRTADCQTVRTAAPSFDLNDGILHRRDAHSAMLLFGQSNHIAAV